jgi:hypothetical protein
MAPSQVATKEYTFQICMDLDLRKYVIVYIKEVETKLHTKYDVLGLSHRYS